MAFLYDYGAVKREVIESGLDAVTLEATGRVVFSCFDTNPAVCAGVVFEEALFDEVADATIPRANPTLWRLAAERLRALRVPGTTPCVTVRVSLSDGLRALIRPYDWTLDGAAVSAPFVPGPAYAGTVDDRPRLAPGDPFVIAVSPGAHRIEASLRLFETGAAPRDVPFVIEVDVASGACVEVEVTASPGEVSVRRVAS
ncbi:MAG: hypothetical protein U0326_19550 [Polyangiales bacterium]